MSVGNMGVIGRGDFDANSPGPIGPAGPTGGIVIIEQESHGFKVGECVRYSGTSWVLARADSEYTLAIGVIIEIGDVDSFTYAMTGRFNVTHGLSVDTWYYLSPTVDGGLTKDVPEITQPLVLTDDPFHYSVMQYRPSFNRDGDHSGGTEGPAGPAGATGPAGPTGSRGIQGPQGQPGPYGPVGPIGPVGAEGIQGTTGLQGAAATLNAGTTTTLNAGEEARVSNSGTSAAAIFNFAIPQGVPGIQGPIGIGIDVKGVVATPANLPPSGNNDGDVYIVESTGDAYVWAASGSWENIGPIGLTGAYLPLTGGIVAGELQVAQVGGGRNAVAIGAQAGSSGQSDYAVAYGFASGEDKQGNSSVALGSGSGRNSQGSKSVAIGNSSGRDSQGLNAVSIGNNSAREGQGDYSIAIGSDAGRENQGDYGIIIESDYKHVNDTTRGHIHLKTIEAHLSFTTLEEWSFEGGNVNVPSLSVDGVPLKDFSFNSSEWDAEQAAQDELIADNANAISAGQAISEANTKAISDLAYQSAYNDSALESDVRRIDKEQGTQDQKIADNTKAIGDIVSFDSTDLEAADAALQAGIDANTAAVENLEQEQITQNTGIETNLKRINENTSAVERNAEDIAAFSPGSGNLDGGMAASNYGGIPSLVCGDARSFT